MVALESSLADILWTGNYGDGRLFSGVQGSPRAPVGLVFPPGEFGGLASLEIFERKWDETLSHRK